MKLLGTASLVLAVFLAGCQVPPAPPEVRKSADQEQDLWRAGASVFAGQDYANYLQALRAARQDFARENLKLAWSRDYGRVAADFRAALAAGDGVMATVKAMKAEKRSSLEAGEASVRAKIATLKDITLSLTERGRARKQLAMAEVYLGEAETLMGQARFEDASRLLSQAGDCVKDAEEAVMAFIARYLDRRQVEVWKKWTDETIVESRSRGTVALVVSKLERRMTVYRGGLAVKSYPVGLGFNGLSSKLHSGDNATPEGRYHIIQKITASQYYKALLIDYPNEEDRRRFAREKGRGAIPVTIGIGGDIEIHGGGPDSLTRGCVSMDNDKMDELFALVSIGTPVTIVGTNETENYVIRTLRK
ncbi:MAG TPA: L,D-transpeptidase [Terriglobales bacterium]|nr:L,D-transpeptidase [Terriglobales bacterium]